MRRFLIASILIVVCSLPAQAQWLKEDQASSFMIKLVKTADNSNEDAATLTGISLSFIKHSDTAVNTVTTVSSDTVAGSANGCVFVAKGMYSCEITAANADTPGRLDVCWTYTGTYSLCRAFMVMDPAFWALAPDGSVFDNTANQAEHDATQATLGTPPTTIAAAVAAAEARTDLLDTITKNTAQIVYVTFFNTNGTRKTDLTAAAITCRVSLDGSTSLITVTDTTEIEISDGDMPGVWRVNLDADETNGDSNQLLCETTGGLYAGASFQPQR